MSDRYDPTAKIGGRFTSIQTDRITGNIGGIDTPHMYVHRGKTFMSSHIFAAVAASGHADINMTNGDAEAHMTMGIKVEANSQIGLYEDSVFTTTVGTTMSAINMNRESLNTASMTVFHTPVIATTGNLLYEDVVFGSATGAGANRTTVGGEIRTGTEIILADETSYTLRITNLLTTTKRIAVVLQWYEEQ